MFQQDSHISRVLTLAGLGYWEYEVLSGSLRMNTHALSILGYCDTESDDVLSEPVHALRESLFRGFVDLVTTDHLDVQGEMHSRYTIEIPLSHKEGRTVWCDCSIEVTEWSEEGKPVALFGTLQDITEQRQERILHTLSQKILDILGSAGTFSERVKEILSQFQQRLEIDAVGLRLKNNMDFPYYETCGFDQQFLLKENSLLETDLTGSPCMNEDGTVSLECTCGLVLSGMVDSDNPLFTEYGSFVTNDSRLLLDIPESDDPRYHPRNTCIEAGYASIALIPIKVSGVMHGLLQLNAFRKNVFTSSLISSLEDISTNMGGHLTRVKMEAALKESQLYNRMLFEKSPLGFAVCRMDGTLTDVNEAFAAIIGRTIEECYTLTYWEITPREYADQEAEQLRKLQESGAYGPYEKEYLHKKGHRVAVLLHGRSIDIQGEKHIWSTVEDISERKQTGLALAKQKKILFGFFELHTSLNLICSVDGTIHQINDSFVSLLGYTREQLIGSNIMTYIHPDDKDGTLQELSTLSEGETTFYFENRYCDAQGIYHLLAWSAVASVEEQIVYAVAHDITQNRAAEKEKQLLTEKLHQSQKMEAIGQLAGGVAHDFNNSLTAILGAAELIVHERLPEEELMKYAKDIVLIAQRAGELTKKLLMFSRKLPHQRKVINLYTILDDTVKLLKHSIDKRITITLETEVAEPCIRGDSALLQNCFVNLGINASHAMPGGGELRILLSEIVLPEEEIFLMQEPLRAGKYYIVVVKDTGMGIAEENLQRIFDPFFTTKRKEKGTGLGLSSVLGTIQDHGGTISVDSTLGEGTTFTMLFPCHEAVVESTKRELSVQRGSGTILLVDDEKLVRTVGKGVLSALGYTVLTAENGQKGVELFTAHAQEIDCIILDIIMPVKDGRAALKEIRALSPHIPVIIASGYGSSEQMEALKELGYNYFLRKPYRRADLIEALQAVNL